MMRRWLFLAFMLSLVIIVGVFGLRTYVTRVHSPPKPVLMTLAKSLYKYEMCAQAYAFAYADASNPYKTDYTFADPFRKARDTIIPHMLDYDPQARTANFTVDVIIPEVNTYHLSLNGAHEEDGVFVLLPDQEQHLRRAQIPQFILASLIYGRAAVIDYTCPQKWSWSVAHTK